jgi:hypothetical protein
MEPPDEGGYCRRLKTRFGGKHLSISFLFMQVGCYRHPEMPQGPSLHVGQCQDYTFRPLEQENKDQILVRISKISGPDGGSHLRRVQMVLLPCFLLHLRVLIINNA